MWQDLVGVSLLLISLDDWPGSCHHIQLSLKTHQKMSRKPLLSVSKSDDSRRHYKEAFSAFDWTNSGRISYGSLKVQWNIMRLSSLSYLFSKAAMRRCGQNPTDIEVSDLINKIHDDSGSLDLEVTILNLHRHSFLSSFPFLALNLLPLLICMFQDFYCIMENRSHDTDPETGYKVGF